MPNVPDVQQPDHAGPFELPAAPLEVHHVVKRAQGGSDFDLDRLIALCPPCHARTDAPYARGRLVITPLGDRFTAEVTRGADKWRSARNDQTHRPVSQDGPGLRR
jgi:hypothetical protein